jgi:ribosome-associated translation inhibitor RaiA
MDPKTANSTIDADDVVVEARGRVTPADVEYARKKVASLSRLGRRAVLYAKADLDAHDDPARARPAFAKAELDLDGQLVRAHATGATMTEAVDLLEARLRERIERHQHRADSMRLRHRDGSSWHHDDAPSPRPDYFPRDEEERELVRRKSFAVASTTPEEAAVELEQLDHDFYLFTNADTGEDNVLQRLGDDRYELLQPSPAAVGEVVAPGITVGPTHAGTHTVEEAIETLDLGELPFVFFLDATTRRGRVVYRRYDGHYGLIVPVDDEA